MSPAGERPKRSTFRRRVSFTERSEVLSDGGCPTPGRHNSAQLASVLGCRATFSVMKTVLPNVISTGLHVVFSGTAVGSASARAGAY